MNYSLIINFFSFPSERQALRQHCRVRRPYFLIAHQKRLIHVRLNSQQCSCRQGEVITSFGSDCRVRNGGAVTE